MEVTETPNTEYSNEDKNSGRVAARWVAIERVEAKALTYDDFLSRYMHHNRPVVITNVSENWPAMSNWTPERLKQRLGGRSVAIGYGRNMPFDQFIDAVLKSNNENPGPYMYRSFLHEILPELLPDVIPQNRFAFPRRYSSPLMPEKWRRPDGYLKLLIGGPGSKFPVMHYDAENAHAEITEIYGEKEFVLFSPEDSPYLYPRPAIPNHSMIDDPVMQDRKRFPMLANAVLHRTILRPGDMIFVPARWWHAARALTTSISVCTNMLDASNWAGFVDEVVRDAAKVSEKSAAKLKSQLTRVDKIISFFERFQVKAPTLARALILPSLIAPLSADTAAEPSRRQLRIRIPTA